MCLDPKLAGFRDYRYWRYEAADGEGDDAVGRARCRENMQEASGGASQFTEDFTLIVKMPPGGTPPRNPMVLPKVTRQGGGGEQETVAGTVDGCVHMHAQQGWQWAAEGSQKGHRRATEGSEKGHRRVTEGSQAEGLQKC